MLSAALTIYQFSSINVDWQISGVELAEHRGAISFYFFVFCKTKLFFNFIFSQNKWPPFGDMCDYHLPSVQTLIH